VENQNLGDKIKSVDRLPLGYHFPDFQSVLAPTAGGVASVGERVTFSSPDENARAGETASKFQRQPTLATPLVGSCCFYSSM